LGQVATIGCAREVPLVDQGNDCLQVAGCEIHLNFRSSCLNFAFYRWIDGD
jgi:hypothetical protein